MATAFLEVANNAASLLAAEISAAALALSVTTGDGTKFPSGTFHVSIDNEIILVTTRTTDVFDPITRAQEGTTEAVHLVGAEVRLHITAKHISDLNTAVNTLEGFCPSAAVLETDYNAYTILYADTNNTPVALTIAASRIVGRKASGGIAAMTGAETIALLIGANLDVGAFDVRGQTLTADGLTSGRVVFAGASGVLSDDSDFTFATDTLTVTKIITGLITASAGVFNGPVVMTSSLGVAGATAFGAPVTMSSSLGVAGASAFGAPATFSSSLGVAGTTSLNVTLIYSSLGVAGAVTLGSTLGVYDAITISMDSETTATNALWISLKSTVTNGDLTGVRSRVYANAASNGANVRGGYFEAKMAAAGKFAAMLEGILSHADYSAGNATISGDVRGFTAHISQGAGLNAANLYGILVSIQTRGDETITTDDVGLMIRNEAVGGNGRTMDAGIKIADLNMGGVTSGYTYGIDLNGVGIATADIRFSGSQIITSSTAALVIDLGSDYLEITTTGSVGLLMSGDIKTDRWLAQDSNTFLGMDTAGLGNLEHTAGSEGWYNTAFGGRTLRGITKGYQNVAIGFDAMALNLTGYENCAVGYSALYTNTAGFRNNAFGWYALNQTTGSGNIGIGYLTARLITTGSYNLFIGYDVQAAAVDEDYQVNIGNLLIGKLPYANDNYVAIYAWDTNNAAVEVARAQGAAEPWFGIGKDSDVVKATYDDKLGFFSTTPIAKPTLVADDVANVITALVNLGLINAAV